MVACYIYISVILNKVIAICLKGCKQEDHCIQISELVESSKQSGITNTKWCMENHRYSVNYVRSKVITFRRILTSARKGVTMHHAQSTSAPVTVGSRRPPDSAGGRPCTTILGPWPNLVPPPHLTLTPTHGLTSQPSLSQCLSPGRWLMPEQRAALVPP